MDTLAKAAVRVLVEVGPSGTLLGMARACLAGLGAGETTVLAPSFDERRPNWDTLLSAVGHVYASGHNIDWRAFESPYARQYLSLPSYPFERRPHWFDSAPVETAVEAVRPLPTTGPSAANSPGDLVVQEVARLLRTSVSEVDLHTPLPALGFDSLMALRLAAKVRAELGVDVPLTRLVEGISIAEAVAQLEAELRSVAAAAVPADPGWIEGEL